MDTRIVVTVLMSNNMMTMATRSIGLTATMVVRSGYAKLMMESGIVRMERMSTRRITGVVMCTCTVVSTQRI